ncbi:MAG: hypothetical protein LBC77_06535 [Spirochaetaceae bacterium]|jgi:sucrose-6-phosphate hydrolase SacC (GH32 family)|nr:hypothetical protein [Spirochaetaceae bacterium]
MSIKWKKLGKIFTPGVQGLSWMERRAQVPTAYVFDSVVRVFFSVRGKAGADGNDVARLAFADYERESFPKRIMQVSQEPVLPLGETGCFDEFGMMPCTVHKINEKYYLYYIGWTRKVSVPYDMAIGAAVSDDGEHWNKLGAGPVLTATVNEPFTITSCSNLISKNGVLTILYVAGVKWVLDNNGKAEIIYRIVKAESDDGINWRRDGKLLIPLAVEHEAQASPAVFEHGGRYHLFFSYRYGLDFRNKDRGYRMGYASSEDMEVWIREDSRAGIDVSPEGWDSEMICYPSFFQLNGQTFMLYCGNNFGETGFGIAVLEEIS